MKKKIFWALLIVCALVFVLAISASAAEMTNYCTVKLTLTNGDEVTAYCRINGDQQVERDYLYKTSDSAGDRYDWADVVVFDCRGQTVVGDKLPLTYTGTGCAERAKNVTTVYLSEYNTHLLGSSFTSKWSSLDTVYISSSVTEVKGFAGSLVRNVVFAENSKLEKISDEAFKECPNLSQINIEVCASLKSIGGNAFRSCTSLESIAFPDGLETIGYNGFYLSALSGTVVVPNSVTKLEAGAFLSTRIETLIMGDGPVTVGNNFLGTYNSKDNAYLKNVYLSDKTTFTGRPFFKSIHPVNFYIVGNDCDAVKNALLTNYNAVLTNSYMTFVSAEDAPESESERVGYGIIYTGYDRCEVFYGSHSFTSENLPFCTATCTVCGIRYNGEDVKHFYELSESYTGEKYLSPCTVSQVCSECGKEETVAEIGAIVACLGYSVTEQPIGSVFGISQSFYVNVDALADYEEVTGKTLAYGVFAVAQERLGDNDVFAEDGTVAEGVINADITSYEFASFELKIIGFTDEYKDLKLAMGAYVAVTDGETTEYSYMQDVTKGELGGDYYFVSYNDIVNAPSTDEEVTQ